MPVMRFLCLLLLASVVAAAQGPNSAPQKSNLKPSDLCSVEGAVVKSTTGEGIKRATVQLVPVGTGRQPYSTFTESGGAFTIRDVAPGRYVINALDEGYAPQAPGQGNTQPRVLDLAPGKNVNGITLRMVPPGVITGSVYDEEGDPVILARVKAFRITGWKGQRQLGEAGSSETNDLGEYRIWGLPPGRYLVAANYHPPRSNPGPPTEGSDVYLLTFHPSTSDTSQATLVEVRPGVEASGIDVDLRGARAAAVRGRVLSEISAKPMRGIRVTLDLRAGSSSVSSYVTSTQNDSGDFEIRDVPPGSYVLWAFASEGKRQLYGRTPVEVSGTDLESVSLVLSGSHTLGGKISSEDGSQLDFGRVGLWLQPLDSASGGENAEIKPDGTFVLPVFEGNYRVRLFGYPQGYYVKSARQGGSEVLESGLTISRSQPPAQLEVVLSPQGGRVDGTALEAQHPASGIRVVLVPDPPRRDREEMYSIATTDDFGRFSLSGLPPGNFKLFAWETVPATDYTDPDFLRAFEDRGTPVRIEEAQQQTVQLEVITADEQIR